MPYKWGGFNTPRQFTARLKADAANGGAPPQPGTWELRKSRSRGDAAVSRFAAGVDCSGFVSHCRRRSMPFSTRELPALSIPLPVWKCAEHVFRRPMLEDSGYRPTRYRGMRD